MNILKKFFFLYKSKTSKSIYLIFIITKFKNIFLKKKIKFNKKNHINFLKKKDITHDYFSSHAFNFLSVLSKFKNFKYLEIGSFEGNSAMFVAKNFPNSDIYCIDNWSGTEEYKDLKFTSCRK
jgi:hypothetical protein